MATIRENVSTLITQITAIADKIRSLSGTAADITPSEMPQKIQDIYDNANVSIQPKDYNFFDWDGKLVYSFTAAELNALSALPSLPTHTGYTGIGWNYTLANLKSLTTLTQPLPCNVGAIYGMADGKTTLLSIEIPTGDTKRDVALSFPAESGGSFTVDWGDNSSDTLSTASNKISGTHTYAAAGNYDIKITPVSGKLMYHTGTHVLGSKIRQKGYLKKVVLGNLSNSQMGSGSVCNLFNDAYNLEIFSFGYVEANSYTPRNLFDGCNKLNAVHFPPDVTAITAYAARNCGAEVVTIPYGVTYINFGAFSGDAYLKYFALPKSITGMSNYPFGGSGIRELIFPAGVTVSVTTSCQYMHNLEKIVLPTTMATVPDNFLSLNVQANGIGATIPYIYIPPTVTAFGSNAFNVRTNVEVMDCRDHTAVPTLSNANSANANKYVVPDALYSAWTTATNWAGKASNIVKVSDYND